MRYVSADEARQTLATILDAVQREPVVIQRRGGDAAVLVSVEEFEKLLALDVAEFNRFCDRVGKMAMSRGLTEAKLASYLKEIGV